MENKKIDTVFGLGVIVFLAVAVFVIGNINAGMVSDQKDYEAAMSNLLQRKKELLPTASITISYI